LAQLLGQSPRESSNQGDFRFWHIASVIAARRHFRSWEQTGSDRLTSKVTRLTDAVEPWGSDFKGRWRVYKKVSWGESSSDGELTDDLRNGAQGPSNGDCRCFAFQREISSSVLRDFFDSIDPNRTFIRSKPLSKGKIDI
jgi:hypothetical protein